MTKFKEEEIQRRAELLSQIQPSSEATDRAVERVRDTLINKDKAKEHLDTGIWQAIMNSRVTKLAAAAAIIIAGALAITFLQQSATPAYALEQTIEAGKDVRYIHFYFTSMDGNTIWKESWLEYDDSGQIKNVRVNWYNQTSEDMPVAAVWKEGKTQMWHKKSKVLRFFEDEVYTAKVLFFVQSYDPTRAVEHLYELQEKGDVKIEIQEPSNRTDPIVITGTYLPNTFLLEGPMPQMREIFFVDQVTKLVTSIELYELEDGKYVDLGVWKYPDYDTLFEAGTFDLEKEVPADVKHLDLMKLDVGLEQTTLTREEIALKVAREFFEAWSAKDYDRAVKIHGYEDPDEIPEIRKKFEEINIIRIISIGEPFPPSPDKSKSSIGIPCTIQAEKNGEIFEWQIDLFVHRVLGHPNRWMTGKFKLP